MPVTFKEKYKSRSDVHRHYYQKKAQVCSYLSLCLSIAGYLSKSTVTETSVLKTHRRTEELKPSDYDCGTETF